MFVTKIPLSSNGGIFKVFSNSPICLKSSSKPLYFGQDQTTYDPWSKVVFFSLGDQSRSFVWDFFHEIPVLKPSATILVFLKVLCLRFIAVFSSRVIHGGSLSFHLLILFRIFAERIAKMVPVNTSVISFEPRPTNLDFQSISPMRFLIIRVLAFE